MKSNNKYMVASAFLLSFFAILFFSATAAADDANGWISPGYGGGGGTSQGGQQYGGCSKNTGDPIDSCNGYSWIFYKWIGSDTSLANDFRFPDALKEDDKAAEISGLCATYGEGTGFWHYGRNARARFDGTGQKSYGWPNQRNLGWDTREFVWGTTWNGEGNRVSGGTWGHFDTISVGNTPGYITGPQLTSYGGTNLEQAPNPDQILYRKVGNNYVQLYKAVRYGHYSTLEDLNKGTEVNNVWKAFQKAYTALYSERYDFSTGLPNVYAFCYGSRMGGKFDGNVSVKANGQSGSMIEVSSDRFTLTFDHYIKRNDTTSQVTATNNYSINGDAGSKTGTERFNQNDQSSHDVWHVERSEASPAVGSTKTYCSTLIYNSSFGSDGNGSGEARAQGCVTVIRRGGSNNGSFTTSMNCSATAAGESKGSGCNKEYNTNSRNWTITHSGNVHNNVGRFDVHANGVDASDAASPYTSGAQAYGVGAKCVRSHSPYTRWWWNYGNGFNETGITLSQTGELDLAAPYGDNKYIEREWDEYITNTYCNLDNGLPCSKGAAGCHCQTTTDTRHHVEYAWHYPGCEDGRTYWQDWHGDNVASKTWDEYRTTGDDSLYLRDQESVSTTRCATINANNSWPWRNATNDATGSYRSSSYACSTITRWRRHIKFSGNTAQIKADTGIRNEATTARSSDYVLDVTGSDGEFTVTFGYSVNRNGTVNAYDTGAENYPVNNSWRSRETIEAADGSGKTYRQNGDYNIDHSYPDFYSDRANTPAVSGWRNQTVTGTLYYGQVVKVCGNLTFGDSVRETDDGSEIESWASQQVGCITIKRNKRDCGNVVGSSGRGSEGFEFSHMYGYNVAKIGAINSTLMSNPIYTQWYPDQARTDTPAYTNTEIYARPGDTVQYQIEYCMGANYAHAVHEANGINDGGVDTTMHVDGDSTATTAASTNRVNNDKRSNYLFGDSLSTFDGTKTTPKIFNYTKRNSDGSINEKESIRDGNNIGSKTSPDGVGTIYSCPIGGGTTTGTNNYYQVAGKVKSKDGNYSVSAHNAEEQYIIDGCTSNRTQSLDVGRQMSEKLQWTNMFFSGDVYRANIKADFLSGAYIRVPYNYTAKPFVTTNNSPKGTVQIGGKLTTTPGIAVFPRKNCALADGVNLDGCNTNNSSTATYATVTKPTTVTFKAYINNESRTFQTDSYVVRANTKSNQNGSTAGGTYATANLNGGGTKLDNDYVVDVPNNVNPGDKICVKMTITPADSHNDPTWATVHGASRASAGAEDTSRDTYTYWALREDGTSTATAVSCSTAVKRPTISVEDSNLYSASNITTSVVSRNNYVYNGGNARNAGNLDYYLFGSWSEYGIFGKVTTGSDGSVNISTLGTASGASLGYSQTSYLNSHKTTVTGYNAQPLTVVTYNGGPKNGTYEYNYSRITRNSSQTRIVYEYETKEDGSRYYRLASKTNQTIAPSSYTFANSPIVNAANQKGVAEKATKICIHSTQTFANVDCDDGKIGSDKIGADAVDVFTTNILDRYGDAKMPYTKTDGAENINGYTNLTETSAAAEQLDGDEGAAMFKNIKGKAFLGYKDGHAVDYDSLAVKNNGNVEGADTNLTAKSVMVYKADTVVINSSLIANNDEKTGSGDFRMPIIIANKVWFTGNPTRVDAVIIAKEELNTCKWNSYNDFLNNILPSFPTKKDGLASNKANEMSSNICNNELRFTAPVVVKGKVIFNRTYGAGGADGGGDQIRRAEIFELNAATYLWSFAEMSRYSQAITTYSRELPSRY